MRCLPGMSSRRGRAPGTEVDDNDSKEDRSKRSARYYSPSRSRSNSRSLDYDSDRDRHERRDRADRHSRDDRRSKDDRRRGRDRDRSRERDRDRDKNRERERDRSRDRDREPRTLPYNAKEISKSDYFQKTDEFRIWLKEEKGKYFDELSGDKARSYFAKFVKAWNRNKLPSNLTHLYSGVDPSSISATSQTAYKWSFASKSKMSKQDEEVVRRTREGVSAATNGPGREPGAGRDWDSAGPSNVSAGGGRMQGPTLPSASDLQLARESQSELADHDRRLKRKRDRLEEKEHIEDLVGPKEVGREGMLEKKRAKREGDKAFREERGGRGDEGLEIDEGTLMGGGDSFKAAIVRRDAAKTRYEHNNLTARLEKEQRTNEIREKESRTMEMLRGLAKERFG
ncbi:hypothetical protein D9758_017079 [Tetrapyrgos nigripes]|uniref:Uncharacterized protein n=1 Tax=Tetrapyrgos nigripes TaxID=182062 RepID=A0A8H5F4S3_9AGAR|nr:hypothetical protein D9758_017079 [Tetrapyrgos nigripes]